MYLLAAVIVVALASLLQTGYVAGTCNPNYGPSGTVVCIDTSVYGYTGKQLATCITDAYMQQKSGGRHVCQNRVTYCYYQCMLEVHDREEGYVTSDCSCGAEGPTVSPITRQPLTTLDPICYSPSGDTCTWYRNCLEKKIPCSGGTDGYALEYAEKFCNRFDEFRYKLSQQGQHWMEATRKCLQVSLVLSLRPFATQTCAALRQLAFNAHPGCYLNPYDGAPSFCNLTVNDMFQIFWIIKGAFVTDPIESLLGLYQVGKQCLIRSAASIVADGKTVLVKMKLRMKNINLISRSKRSVPVQAVDANLKFNIASRNIRHRRQIVNTTRVGATEEELLYHRLASELSAAIGSRQRWTEKGLIWFAYGQRGENSSIVEAYVLLADKRSYGLVEPLLYGPAIDMTSLLNSTAEAFQAGNLNGITLQGQHLQLMTFSSCQDDNCQRAAFTVDAPPDLSGSDAICVSFTALTALLLLGFHITLF